MVRTTSSRRSLAPAPLWDELMQAVGVPPSQAAEVWQRVARSRLSVCTSLVYSLWRVSYREGTQPIDVCYLLLDQLLPKRFIETLEALVQVGELDRKTANAVSEQIFCHTDQAGRWR